MKESTANIEFHYLHRDEGNYKIHGSIIFRNQGLLSPAEAAALIKEKLIDGEYFYPNDVKIPLFEEHLGLGGLFTGWYEFLQFSLTDKSPTDSRNFEEFYHSL